MLADALPESATVAVWNVVVRRLKCRRTFMSVLTC